jgi:hypothetical protein
MDSSLTSRALDHSTTSTPYIYNLTIEACSRFDDSLLLKKATYNNNEHPKLLFQELNSRENTRI